MKDLLFQLVLFLSNAIQAITGFAGTMLAMPFSIRLVGITEAKAVLDLFALCSCLLLCIQNRAYVNKKILAKMAGGMLLGMGAGMWLIQHYPISVLLLVYAWFIILVSCKKMFWKKEVHIPSWGMLLVLIASGIIHGMFLSGGALLVVYAAEVLKNKDEFRATVASLWVLLNGLLAIVYYQAGYYTPVTLKAAAISVIPLFVSLWVGNRLYCHLNQKNFLKLVYVLLLISGVSLLL